MKRLEIDYTLGAMDALVSLARYNFVNRTVNNKRLPVLDFGCGSGYGTKVLKEHFTDVTSFDVYPDGYLPKGIEVIQDIGKIKRKKYDVITCFEVIEHLADKDQVQLLNDLHALLTSTGTLFISTVRKMDPPPTENRRKEHIKELSFEELLSLCEAKFNNVYTFGQIDQVISTFYKENHYHFVFICTGKK
ncbi:MAG: class I SAM-dependent methyltransferase [Chitinophagaceae bacterium]|nr:class I SAM-dependent methyltransferase [Chitinophagaceae bacterium]